METILIIVAVLLSIAGIVGSIAPIIPGPPLSYAGLLILHFARGGIFSTTFLVVMGIIAIAAVIIDYALPVYSAKMFGAHKYGMIGSAIGMFVGLVVFAFVGMMVGMFLGAVIGEYLAGKKTGQALKSGTASFLGGIAAMAAKLAICLVMTFYLLANIT